MFQPLRLRVALGLGDQELEQRVRPSLDAAEDVMVVAQCLAADQLLEAVDTGEVDALVVAWSRVYVRIHHASDVLGGIAVGMVLGRVGRSLFPLARSRESRPRPRGSQGA